ncbi:hypothetical protein [Haloferula sp. A504]|uniref:hypothetical protein n=1 Tax=Haloferula sp. A504 TaxID=3373601 RepID=UPI0031BC74D3|nr:hypothetical protein [Verrucomicrobiaceae bacterium E54]
MNTSITAILLAAALAVGPTFAPAEDDEDAWPTDNNPPLWPTTVTISPAKRELLPGETMEIILSGMLDPLGKHADPDYKVIVTAMGMIANGEPCLVPHGKKFVIGEDYIIRLHYVAPSVPAANIDTIRVYRSHDIPEALTGKKPDEMHDLEIPPQLLGSKKIKIINANFMRVTQSIHDHHQSSSGKSWSKEDIEVTMVLRFKPMGGMGFSIPYNITSAEVVSFSGSIERSDGEHAKLTDATVGTSPTAMNLHLSPETGEVDAVVPTAFSAKLEWTSTEDLSPPRDLDFGPVTDYDNREQEKALRAERKEIKQQIRDGEPGSLERLFSLQQKIAAASTHRDQKVTFRNSDKNFGGKAELKKLSSSHTKIETYSWEVVMD